MIRISHFWIVLSGHYYFVALQPSDFHLVLVHVFQKAGNKMRWTTQYTLINLISSNSNLMKVVCLCILPEFLFFLVCSRWQCVVPIAQTRFLINHESWNNCNEHFLKNEPMELLYFFSMSLIRTTFSPRASMACEREKKNLTYEFPDHITGWSYYV